MIVQVTDTAICIASSVLNASYISRHYGSHGNKFPEQGLHKAMKLIMDHTNDGIFPLQKLVEVSYLKGSVVEKQVLYFCSSRSERAHVLSISIAYNIDKHSHVTTADYKPSERK